MPKLNEPTARHTSETVIPEPPYILVKTPEAPCIHTMR